MKYIIKIFFISIFIFIPLVGCDLSLPREESASIEDLEQILDISSTKGARYVEYSDELFEEMKKSGSVLLFFYSDNCATCAMLDNEIQVDIESLPEGLIVLRVDFDNRDDLRDQYDVDFKHSILKLDKYGVVEKRWGGGI